MELLICILPFLLANSIVFAFQTKQSNYVKSGQHSISNQTPLLKTAPTLVSCATKCLQDPECKVFAFSLNDCLLKIPSCSTAYSEADALLMDCFVQKSNDNDSPQNGMTTENPLKTEWIMTVNQVETKRVGTLEELDKIEFPDSDTEEVTVSVSFPTPFNFTVTELTIETTYCMENMLFSSGKCHVIVNKVGMSFTKATEICHGLAGNVSTSMDLSVTKGIEWLTTKLDDEQKAWIEASSETDCNIFHKETGVVESTGANDCNDQHDFVICDFPFTDVVKPKGITSYGTCYLGFNLRSTYDEANSLCNDLGFKLAVPFLKKIHSDTTIPLDMAIFKTLIDSATGNPLESAWIGIRSDGQKYTKIDGTPFYINGTDVIIMNPGKTGCFVIVQNLKEFMIDPDCGNLRRVVCSYTCSKSFKADMKINDEVIVDSLAQYDGVYNLMLGGPILTNKIDITKMGYVFLRTRPGRHGQIKLISYKTED